MYYLFSNSEIYELKKMIKVQKNKYINNIYLDKSDKIESLNNFNKILLNMERQINGKK